MKETSNKKKSGKGKKGKSPFKLKQREKIALVGFVLLIITVVFILSLSGNNAEEPEKISVATKVDEPPFVKEGELYFLDQESGDTLKRIDIEIADNNKDRAQGMMYRTAMADTRGMLFVFDQAEEQSFWMKNTVMTLDILYADENGKLVTLYKYTTPYSENSIPSFEKAKYVVEVAGGFTDRYKIDRGDIISFTRTDEQ